MSSFKNSDSKKISAFQQTNSPKKNAPMSTDAVKNAKFQGQKTDFQQAGNKNPNELERCIENTSKLYRLSNAARESIISDLNNADLQGEISLKIGDLDIVFQRKIINGYIEAEIPTKKLYKIMNLDDLKKDIS